MASVGTWDDFFQQAEKERFAGREQELDRFREEIKASTPQHLIFYIYGQGGVGKTTLLNRYRDIARDAGYLIAETDEQQPDIPSVLGRFANQLSDQGITLKGFDNRYKTYQQKRKEIAGDPNAPQGVFELLGRTAVNVAFAGGSLLPGGAVVAGMLPKDDIASKAGEYAAYLAKKLTDKDDVALMREPIPILSELFFKDLNAIAKEKRVLLCFETFEVTRSFLQDWFLHLREYKPSQNFRLAIAGRDMPGGKWGILSNATLPIKLEVFTPQEAEKFLDLCEINNLQRRKEILELSNRLPVLMSWLADAQGTDGESAAPTSNIVERFLQWVPDPAYRQWALLAAVPQFLNIDLLGILAKNQSTTYDARTAFEWLKTMSFVQQHAEGWQYHSVVRLLMLRYQRQSQPQTYAQLHAALADFYNGKRNEASFPGEDPWTSQEWRKETLLYLYHYLGADRVRHWMEVISLIVVGMYKRWTFALEMIDRLDKDDARIEMDDDQYNLLRFIHQQSEAFGKASGQDTFAFYDRLCRLPHLSEEASGYALSFRAGYLVQNEQWEEALKDLNKALEHVPGNSMVLMLRGMLYLKTGHNDEALEDLNKVLTQDTQGGIGLVVRGLVYFITGRYKEALDDVNHVLDLDEKDTTALTIRWMLYFTAERYDKALEDVNRLFAIFDQNWAMLDMRGFMYWVMERYDEAFADLNKALALNEHDALALAYRGMTYFMQDKYQEAFEDLDKSIALDSKNTWVLGYRGPTHFFLGNYQEALADLSQVLEQDANDVTALRYRGATYYYLNSYAEALRDLSLALEQDKQDLFTLQYRGPTNFLLEHYEDALADLSQVLEQNDRNMMALRYRGATYYVLRRYEPALSDLNLALEQDANDVMALRFRGATYYFLNRFEEALSDLSRALEQDKQNLFTLQYRGATYFFLNRYEEALADLSLALQQDEKNAMALRYRGATYYYLNRYDEALADLSLALTQDEKNAMALRYRGATQFYLGHFDEALADLSRALEEDEKSGMALRYRGATYYALRRYEDALSDLNGAVEQDEKNVMALRYRGITHFYLGNSEEALADLSRALEQDNQDEIALAYRGATFFVLRRYEEALGDLNHPLIRDEQNDMVLEYRGASYFYLGHYEEALANLKRALEIDEQNSWALVYRGMTYYHLNRNEEALADFNRLIGMEAQSDWNRYLRARVYKRLGQKDDYESDLHAAVDLVQKALLEQPDEWGLRFNLALYHLALGDDATAEAEYGQFASECSNLLVLESAMEDLVDYLEAEPSSVVGQRVRTVLQERIGEVRG